MAAPTLPLDFDALAMCLMLSSSNSTYRDQILTARGTQADAMQDLIQKTWINRVVLDHPLRRSAIQILLQLTQLSDRFSPCVLADCGGLVVEQDPFKWGGFGILFRGELDDQPVVVKRIVAPGDHEADVAVRNARKEVLTWHQLYHPNILALVGVNGSAVRLNPHDVQIITPRIQGLDLLHFVTTSPFNQDENQVPIAPREANAPDSIYNPSVHRLIILIQIAGAVRHLHYQKIVHGDISAANILVESLHDQSIHVHLCDFGLTVVGNRTAGRVATTLNPAGTVHWMAPERIRDHDRLDTPVDIYAFGCVSYTICTGQRPFHTYTHGDLASRIISSHRPALPSKTHPNILATIGFAPSEAYWEMVERCWITNPGRRPTIATILLYLGNTFDEGLTRIPGNLPSSVLCLATITKPCGVLPGAQDQGFINASTGTEVQVYDITGEIWLVRKPNGAVGYIKEKYLTAPFLLKARAINASSPSKKQEQPSSSRWLRKPDGNLHDLAVLPDEYVNVVTAGERRWVVRNKKGNIGYVDSANLKVGWPSYEKTKTTAATAVCTLNAQNRLPHVLSFTRSDVLHYLERTGDWAIAWKRPGSIGEEVGLIPMTHVLSIQ